MGERVIKIQDVPKDSQGRIDLDAFESLFSATEPTTVLMTSEEGIELFREAAGAYADRQRSQQTLRDAARSMGEDMYRQTFGTENRFWRTFYRIVAWTWVATVLTAIIVQIVRVIGG